MLRFVGCRVTSPQIQVHHRVLHVNRSDRLTTNTRAFVNKPFLHNKDELIKKSIQVEEDAKKFLEKHKVTATTKQPFVAVDKLVSEFTTRPLQRRFKIYEQKMREAEEEEEKELGQEEQEVEEEEEEEEEVFQVRKRLPAVPVKLVWTLFINVADLQRNITSWSNLQLDSGIVNRLSELGFHAPTDVQKEAMQYVSQGADVAIQSQTGTGKTFVFLLPLLTKIKNSDAAYQCLILTPSRELAVQIGDELMKVASIPKEGVPSLFQIIVGGSETLEKQVLSVVEHKPKFLIGTPGRIQDLFGTDSLKFLKVVECFKYLVLDEADRILQPPSRYETSKEKLNRIRHPPPGTQIFQELVNKNPTVQLVCTSATVNSPLRKFLKHWWPREFYFVKSGSGFGIPPQISHFLISPKGTAKDAESEKIQQLLALFYSQQMTSLLVFISNESKILQFVDRLKAKGVAAVALHTAMTVYEPGKRGKMLDLFKKGEIQMIVATDETVRGLDFDWIANVAVMSVPKDANTYLHIAGRTGRQGRHGRVFMFAAEVETRKLNAIGSYLGIKWTPIEDI